jgi:NAD(P)-dependent dehydrogenase (short-subunit alcohol dehydrogenase family)
MAGRTCLITGASRGIGLAAALRFAHAGNQLVVVARQAPNLAEARRQIEAAGAWCETVQGDVSRPDDVQQLVAAARARFGRIDVLVNNAGCAPLARIEGIPLRDFDEALALNMAAVFHTTRAVWPHMREQGGGVIVNVSSVASVDPFPGFAVYGASKAWVNLFSQAAAAESKPDGIRVFSVAPGAVETPLLRTTFPDLPAEKTLAASDVANVIYQLCEESFAPCSGQTFFVRR